MKDLLDAHDFLDFIEAAHARERHAHDVELEMQRMRRGGR